VTSDESTLAIRYFIAAPWKVDDQRCAEIRHGATASKARISYKHIQPKLTSVHAGRAASASAASRRNRYLLMGKKSFSTLLAVGIMRGVSARFGRPGKEKSMNHKAAILS
jgi:hypothetical protein